MFRLQGGEWVAREIVKDVQRGRAKFVLNTGDMVWWGKQGDTPSAGLRIPRSKLSKSTWRRSRKSKPTAAEHHTVP